MLRRAAAQKRLISKKRRGAAETVARPSDLEYRAARAVGEYLDANAAILERAERLREKAERLEKAGIPSESARNRAERACGEVVAGLAALRASFSKAARVRGATFAFDRVLERRCPAFTSSLTVAPPPSSASPTLGT